MGNCGLCREGMDSAYTWSVRRSHTGTTQRNRTVQYSTVHVQYMYTPASRPFYSPSLCSVPGYCKYQIMSPIGLSFANS
jgi:hypothetical protein